jgi:hypothetical protein
LSLQAKQNAADAELLTHEEALIGDLQLNNFEMIFIRTDLILQAFDFFL